MDPAARNELNVALSRLASGDRAAFRPVFSQAEPVVRRFVARLVPPADADDAAQQALLNVFARAAEYDGERDALTWILAIAAYESRTFRNRALRRREALGADVSHLPAGDSPEQTVVEADLRRALGDVMRTLRPDDVSTLAAALNGRRPDVAPATFRKRLERAVARLRTAWRARHGAE